tara:strand:+ start:53 stop:667 length:615 start_codon:yes stop_codon:yes gene_type:complete
MLEIKRPATSQTVAADAKLPTKFGDFRIRAFPDPTTGKEHAALYAGDLHGDRIPLVRVHSECLTGDAFGSLRCDCGPQLDKAMQAVQEHGSGIVLYLRQEGRGIGLAAKMKAYRLQDRGYDTLDANLALGLPADARNYTIAVDMLISMGVTKIRLMTNNPDKIQQLEDAGIEIVERVEHQPGKCKENEHYLRTKAIRMGHLLQA